MQTQPRDFRKPALRGCAVVAFKPATGGCQRFQLHRENRSRFQALWACYPMGLTI
jgi:hypothetical protein